MAGLEGSPPPSTELTAPWSNPSPLPVDESDFPVPSVVTVDRGLLLTTALSCLSQSAWEEHTETFNEGLYVSTITIDLPPHSSSAERCRKSFYGTSTETSSLATKAACEAALNYLQDNRLIVMDAFNSKVKSALFRANCWADLFQDKLTRLQKLLERTKVLQQDIVA